MRFASESSLLVAFAKTKVERERTVACSFYNQLNRLFGCCTCKTFVLGCQQAREKSSVCFFENQHTVNNINTSGATAGFERCNELRIANTFSVYRNNCFYRIFTVELIPSPNMNGSYYTGHTYFTNTCPRCSRCSTRTQRCSRSSRCSDCVEK